MNKSYIASEIKNRISMYEILTYYGFNIKNGNRIPCPFHNGEDLNCGVKRDYIHCFVCGESADQIAFVQKYFNLSFSDAVSKINSDFSLGLPIEDKIDRRKQIQFAKEQFYKKQRQNEKKKTKDDLFCEIIELNKECANIKDFIKTCIVKPFDFNLAQIKANAISRVEYINYIIEEKERELSYIENQSIVGDT